MLSRPELAYIQYKSFRLDLLSGERENFGAEALMEELEEEAPVSGNHRPKVFHLFYEFGHISSGMPELADERSPLAIVLHYTKSSPVDLDFKSPSKTKFEPVEFPSFEEYEEKFSAGMEKLLDGECYQFNLTSPFIFRADGPLDLSSVLGNAFSSKRKLGAYAHYTHLGALNRGLLSNSPECLFQALGKRKKIFSMPIKGTYKLRENEDHQAGYEKLKASKKDEGELFMITDLVRNDLTAIQMRPSKIACKKKRLDVPGLSHQYSIIETDIDESANLRLIIEALFPGGSITGAPKKRTMRILKELEGYDRGLYCGSTIVIDRGLFAGSINIRSAEIDYSAHEIKYCAGGGVTLKSTAKGEFEESYAKMESFLQLFSYH